MSTIINASTSGGLVTSADTSGTLELQSAGATKFTVSSTGAYGSLVSGTAVTASGTSIDFTGIPSWAKRVTVMFDGVSTNGTSFLLIQLGDLGGVENTGYNSYAANFGGAGITGNSSTVGFLINSNAAARLNSGAVVFTNITGNIWAGLGGLGEGVTVNGQFIVGSKTLSATLDRIRITTVNGTDTFDAGTINIMYEG